jgi:hypothetical protein
VNFCLSVTYAIVAVTLTVEDEELHITVTILVRTAVPYLLHACRTPK